MATWNADKPALANQIANDIPDIKENFTELKDILQAITNGTLGTTEPADFKVDVLADDCAAGTHPVITTGVNDGTQDIDFPTNGMAAAKFMLGTSDTIAWFYLNTAPPGWKVLATGKDTVLAVFADSGDYAVAGGNPDTASSWEIDGLTADNESAHTHTGPSHNHAWLTYTSSANWTYDSGGSLQNPVAANSSQGITEITDANAGGPNPSTAGTWYTNKTGTGNTGAGTAHGHTISCDQSYRPKASVGKLFQLDTA